MNIERIEAIIRDLITEIGENPDREGLKDTPARVARFWQEFVEYKAGNTDTVFESITTDQMVVVKHINVWSLCEHHLMPFECSISIGYITVNRVLGLSKFARVAQECAHKLQIQERLVSDVADRIQSLTESPSVAVLAKGNHLCMTMRGIRSDATMITSVMRGVFLNNPSAKSEFLNLIE